MKLTLILPLLMAFIISGCATVTSPVSGVIVKSLSHPINATSNKVGSKEGTAACKSILGIIAIGDCSIKTAAKNGAIKSISTVDVETLSVFGLYAEYKVVVTGE